MPGQPETFNEQTWQERIKQRLQSWKRPASYSLYGFLGAMSLWPLVEAMQQGQVLPVALALGSVAGNVGANLLANQVQSWADSGSVQIEDVMAWLERHVQDNDTLRAQLDAVLVQLQVMQMAKAGLGEEDRAWFVQTLREELQGLGNWGKYEAVFVVEQSGIGVGHDVNNSIINTGKIVFQVYQHPLGQIRLDEKTFQRILQEYLKWVVRFHNSKARLFSEREGARAATGSPVRQLADVFIPVTLRQFFPPKRKQIDELSRELGDDPWAVQKAFLTLARQMKTDGEPVSLKKLLTVRDKLAIVGGAGSGKSTLVDYLALSLAQHVLTGAPIPFDLPVNRKVVIPLPVPLRYFQKYQEAVKASPGRKLDKPQVGTLVDFIPWYFRWQNAAMNVSEDFFHRLLKGGGALLMLDGLDEIVRGDEREWMRQEVEHLVNHVYPGNLVIVTAREAGYRGNAIFSDDFLRLDVQPLDQTQIATLTRNWCAQLYPNDVKKQADEIVDAIADINARYLQQKLPPPIETPLMTTMVISVKWGETELPRERAKLYDAAVRVVLQAQYLNSDEARDELINWGGPWEEQREWLSHLALAMHGQGKGRALASEEQVKSYLSTVMKLEQLNVFLTAIRSRGSLLQEQAGLFQFIHLTFQEFLAARLLAKQRQDAWPQLQPHIRDSWWREVFLLHYGFAKVDYAPYAQEFLDWLSTLSDTDDATRLAGLELAAAAVLEIERPDPDLRRSLAEKLADAITNPVWQTPTILRAKAANTLARLGDPRPGVGLDEQGLPHILWSQVIAPGSFIMGNTKETDPMAFAQEAPQFDCHLITEPYRISIYPITVAQYRAFIEARGYEESRYWTDAGWRWKESKGVTGPADYGEPFSLANHPQVGVSWYEAVAFCNWLSEQTGQTIQLPTEAQWERAARHSDGRRYPWSEEKLAEPDPDRMNYVEAGIGATSTVGVFPAGQAVCGAQDMSGNVWEWCRTQWRDDYENYEAQVDDTPEGDYARVVRGGAFFNFGDFVRCACRRGGYPHHRVYFLGFRVVASLSPR